MHKAIFDNTMKTLFSIFRTRGVAFFLSSLVSNTVCPVHSVLVVTVVQQGLLFGDSNTSSTTSVTVNALPVIAATTGTINKTRTGTITKGGWNEAIRDLVLQGHEAIGEIALAGGQ